MSIEINQYTDIFTNDMSNVCLYNTHTPESTSAHQPILCTVECPNSGVRSEFSKIIEINTVQSMKINSFLVWIDRSFKVLSIWTLKSFTFIFEPYSEVRALDCISSFNHLSFDWLEWSVSSEVQNNGWKLYLIGFVQRFKSRRPRPAHINRSMGLGSNVQKRFYGLTFIRNLWNNQGSYHLSIWMSICVWMKLIQL